MSELTTNESQQLQLRKALLANVSTLAMLGYLWTPSLAQADDSRPTVWIELGSQLERSDAAPSIFAPKFLDLASPDDIGAMVGSQRPSRYEIGGEGKISIEPAGTNWVYSAAVRYGRSNASRHLHHETPGLPNQYFTVSGAPFAQYTPVAKEFGDGQTTRKDTYFVLDFKAGKDIGIGLLGSHSSSIFSVGMRFAQFTSKSDVTLHARPVNDVNKKYYPGAYRVYTDHRRTYTAVLHTERNSHAIGPSFSWDASAEIAGTDNATVLTFDWGINAAILFGRHFAKTQHQTKGRYLTGLLAEYTAASYSYNGPPRTRSRTVTIPNVGGFAGLSLKFPNAKVSLGYRADIYLNATDSGIDSHQSSDQKFYGPFAAISIGF